MPSPFPGMDPYIEEARLWGDFHSDLAGEIRAALNAQIRPRYVARTIEYITYDLIEIEERAAAYPDVSVWQQQRAVQEAAGAAPAVTPAPVESLVELEVPVRLHSVQVRLVETQQLVTAIEILSPVNKNPSHKAHAKYQRKRQELLQSDAHFMELDLLRGGTRSPLKRPVPQAAYYVTLSRVEERPRVKVWPIQIHDPLPVLPVPLRHPDPDATLDLGALAASVYERGGYEDILDYSRPPPSPKLSEAEAEWLDRHLRAQSKR